MTITVTSGNSSAPSIAGNTNSAASGQGGGANSLFALLFADAQLGSGQGLNVLMDNNSELLDHLRALLAVQDARPSAEIVIDPLAAAVQNPRLAFAKADDGSVSESNALVEDLLSQIKDLNSKEKEAPQIQSELAPTDPIPLVAPIDPSQLAKVTPQTTSARDVDGITDVLASKKNSNPLLAALSTDEPSQLSAEDALKSTAAEKTSGNEFGQQLSQALNGSRRPDGEAMQPKPIQAHVHDQQVWPKQLGDRVVWMTQQGQQTAEIHLNPAQLGPLQITLNLSQENATAVFVSQHAEVRQALQDALPQLREMLAGSGINLGQANVSDQGPKEQQNHTPNAAHVRTERDTAILQDGAQTGLNHRVTPIHRDNGSIDLFA